MTVQGQRRPISSHPAFVPLIALWSAALLGLTVMVLPAAAIERGLQALGLAAWLPITTAVRIGVSLAAALVGATLGWILARRGANRAGSDPRPTYAEVETYYEAPVSEAPARRPLHVREELADGFGDDSQVLPAAPDAMPRSPRKQAQEAEGFMILTPQPVHPPRPAPDLEALLDQFDTAFAAFRANENANVEGDAAPTVADPVHAFVAKQTGAPPPDGEPSISPIGGLVPDHQAELRAALDKLARSQRKD